MAKHRFLWAPWLGLALASGSMAADAPVSIVSERHAHQDWTATVPLPAPAYPANAGDIGSVCVNMGYYLGPDGTPSDFAVVKSWSKYGPQAGKSSEHLALFEKTAIATLMQARFMPVHPGRPRPIYTSTTFVFAPVATGGQAELRARCEVRNLREFLVQARKAADPATWETLRWNAEWFKNKNTRIHGLNRE